MKTLTLDTISRSSMACGGHGGPHRIKRDDDTVATMNSRNIVGANDTGDACVVGVFAHAPGSTSGTSSRTIIDHTPLLTAAHA